MDPEVSIIMSEYNTNENILRTSIKSILNQTFDNFEFIIVNDGNSDILNSIVSEYNDSRIKIITNKKNLGLPKSLNKAILASKGKYLARMDTDDIAHPNRISSQYKFATTHSQYSVIGTSINLLSDGQRIPKVYKGEIDKNKLMNRISPVHPSVMMIKEDVIEVGMYDESMKKSQDFALWSELLLANKRIFIMPDILLDYRVNLEDYNKRKLRNRKYEIRSRLKYYRKFKASPLQYLSILKSVISGILPNKIMYYYHNKII